MPHIQTYSLVKRNDADVLISLFQKLVVFSKIFQLVLRKLRSIDLIIFKIMLLLQLRTSILRCIRIFEILVIKCVLKSIKR